MSLSEKKKELCFSDFETCIQPTHFVLITSLAYQSGVITLFCYRNVATTIFN